jgi:RNA polymerase sigma-70 factor (ECF subfamily)
MEDTAILDLFFCRDESAIQETDKKYGRRLRVLSQNITDDPGDAEECCNDTYFYAWNSIPPIRPTYYFAWLAKVIRSLSYKKWEKLNTQKRRANMVELTKELEECISDCHDVISTLEAKRLGNSVNAFVKMLPSDRQMVFIRRYFYGDSIAEISQQSGFSASKVISLLFRLRKQLKAQLEKEGFDL